MQTPRSPSARSISCASALVLVLLLAGCGGKSASEKRACERAAEQAAAAAVARNGYNAGRAGGRAGLRKFFSPGEHYLDGDGRLLPYDELKGRTKYHFDQWMADLDARGVLAKQMLDARLDVRTNGAKGCD